MISDWASYLQFFVALWAIVVTLLAGWSAWSTVVLYQQIVWLKQMLRKQTMEILENQQAADKPPPSSPDVLSRLASDFRTAKHMKD